MSWLVAALLAQTVPIEKEKPHTTPLGIYYMPSEGEEIERIVRGNPGGRQGFNLALAAVARFDGGKTSWVWKESLRKAAEHGRGRLRLLLDVHVLTEHEGLHDLLVEILRSEHADLVAGWYVCDEPFAKSRKDREEPLDIKPIWDLVNTIRRVERTVKKKQIVVADYGSTQAMLRKGADPVNGGWFDHTARHDDREVFLWDGRWVDRVEDRAYNEGRPIVRRYGCFGEDVTMINWYGDAAELKRWLRLIVKDVPASRIQIVCGYDVGEDTPEQSDAARRRVREIVDVGEVSGYWLWPWKTCEIGGRTYKGVREWWEDDPDDPRRPRRYANLIEEIP